MKRTAALLVALVAALFWTTCGGLQSSLTDDLVAAIQDVDAELDSHRTDIATLSDPNKLHAIEADHAEVCGHHLDTIDVAVDKIETCRGVDGTPPATQPIVVAVNAARVQGKVHAANMNAIIDLRAAATEEQTHQQTMGQVIDRLFDSVGGLTELDCSP